LYIRKDKILFAPAAPTDKVVATAFQPQELRKARLLFVFNNRHYQTIDRASA
jgi:hypothetical protein